MTQTSTSPLTGHHTLQDDTNVGNMASQVMLIESRAGAQPASTSGGCTNQTDSDAVKPQTFFKVAERSLTNSTLLGQTNMVGVDFFAQTFEILDTLEAQDGSETVIVAPNDRIVVVAFLRLAIRFYVYMY